MAADDMREKHRWAEINKVYTRRNFKKNIKKKDATSTTNGDTADATPTATATATTVCSENMGNNADSNAIDTATTMDTNTNTNQKDDPPLSPQVVAVANSSQEQTLVPLNAVSDGSSSGNPPQELVAAGSSLDCPNENGIIRPVITIVEDRVRIDFGAARSKNDIKQLKRKLEGELDDVRSVMEKLEAKEIELTTYSNGAIDGGYSDSQYFQNGLTDREGLAMLSSEVVSGVNHGVNHGVNYEVNHGVNHGVNHEVNYEVNHGVNHGVNHEINHRINHQPRPFKKLNVSVTENNHGVCELVEKEKRTPKANQYYRNSEFLLGKDRLPPPESKKKLKTNSGRKHGSEAGYRFYMDKYMSQVFKSCGNLLTRLMKHKHAWVFNKPVDAKSLGLQDYHDIIKHPMDLGTIKTRLAKNWYKSPREFAEDVRLTFYNAMTYNPKGQDVHIMAEQMSEVFEEKWAVIEADFNLDWRYETVNDIVLPTPASRKTANFPPYPVAPEMRNLDRSEYMTGGTVQADSKVKAPYFTPAARPPIPRKPKAKDPDKRDMTYEEKQRLSTNLQSLPPEKLDGIVHIIRKRNSAVCQREDEVEVDIDSVDAETLWELDRFVTNYKKTLSKNKRKAEIALQARREANHAIPSTHPASENVESRKESKTDQNQVATSSPVQGVNQGDNSSSSSSSSSDSSSSSSDSDSDSSSDGSDEGNSPRN